MNPLPRTGSYLVDSMLFAIGALCFTLAVGLVVIVGALLIQATMLVSEPYVGSRSAASVLAILVFAVYVGVPSYLIARYTDDPEGRADVADSGDVADSDGAADPDDAAERRAHRVADHAPHEQAVTADSGEEQPRESADSVDEPDEAPRHEAARCDGARPEGEHDDPPEGEGP